MPSPEDRAAAAAELIQAASFLDETVTLVERAVRRLSHVPRCRGRVDGVAGKVSDCRDAVKALMVYVEAGCP